MSYGYAAPITGVVTQAATAAVINIPIPGSGDLMKFEIWDETQFGKSDANTDMLLAVWYRDMPAGSAFVYNRNSGNLTAFTSNMVITDGFTLIDPSSSNLLQAQKTGTTITGANPAVASVLSHGYSNGDVVRISNSTGLLQISSLDFSISNVSTNAFDLAWLDSTVTNLSGGATAFKVQKLNFGPLWTPSRYSIVRVGTASALGVSGAGSSSIITLSVTHNFTVGQAVRIYVPNTWISSGNNVFVNPGAIGTASTSQLIVAATITAINTADASGLTNTITVNINSTGTTFTWPTSAAAAAGITYPFVEPVGEAATTSAGLVNPANLLDDRTRNTGQIVMSLGSNVYGVANDVLRWIAWRGLVQS